MLVEYGHFALILAFALASAQVVLGGAGVMRGVEAWMAAARWLSLAQFALVTLAFGILANAFLHDDFSVRLIAEHSNTLLPWWYKISAVWGNHEGSMLLWVFILAGWTSAVALWSDTLSSDMRARVLSVMALIAVGFYLFILLTSNPFARTFPDVPTEGRDLNPLLQDIGLVLHPPILYLGYVGFSVAFAFAIAALWSGQLDSAWARWSRPWTNAAWMFLSLGITLGSWWAYYELGWGGWWFWDPVENASFMPWLAGTALLHSLAATEKRGVFRSWTALLAILSFSLSLLGTFLVRSGVLTSVHAFATDPARGLFVLVYLGVVVGGSLMLYALRAPGAARGGEFTWLSRETAILGNNVLLTVAMATVLIGTLCPLVITALDLGRLSVGPPYFNLTFAPLIVILALVMGVGPLLRWRASTPSTVRDHIRAPVVLSVAAGIAFPFVYAGQWHAGAALTAALCTWLVTSLIVSLRARLAEREGLPAILRLGGAYWGMWFAHLGMAFCIGGAGFASVYSIERDVRMAPGDQAILGAYTFEFVGMQRVDGPNYLADRAEFRARRGGADAITLHAEKRNYKSQMGNVMTEAAIDGGFFRDLYVSLGEPLGDGSWAIRVHCKPFVRWLWIGGVIMAIGALSTLLDRRYHRLRASRPVIADAIVAGARG